MPSSSAKRRQQKAKFGDNKALLWLVIIPIAVIAVYMQVQWMKQETIAIQPTQKIPCPHCEGKGQLRNPNDVPNMMDCAYCFGTGLNYIRRLGREFEICPVCIGMGRERYNADALPEECRSCKGWGVFKRMHEDVTPAPEIKPYIDDAPTPLAEIAPAEDAARAPVDTPAEVENSTNVVAAAPAVVPTATATNAPPEQAVEFDLNDLLRP